VVFEGFMTGEYSQGGIEGRPGEGEESVATLREGGVRRLQQSRGLIGWGVWPRRRVV
jgi:hypothetical protein